MSKLVVYLVGHEMVATGQRSVVGGSTPRSLQRTKPR